MAEMQKLLTLRLENVLTAASALEKLAKLLNRNARSLLATNSQYKRAVRYCERVASLCFH